MNVIRNHACRRIHASTFRGTDEDEILAIALFKIGLLPTDIFVDVGCGTGKVSLTAASQVREVIAIDRREEAVLWTKKEIGASLHTNITVFHGDGAEILSGLSKIDAAFIGGSQNLTPVIRELKRLRVRSLVITAVMLETLYKAIAILKEEEFFKEVIQAHISKSVPIGSGIMLKPIDPVFIIHGGVS